MSAVAAPNPLAGSLKTNGGGLFFIPDVEIFRVGTTAAGTPDEETWKVSDLDAFVRNFELAMGESPPAHEVPLTIDDHEASSRPIVNNPIKHGVATVLGYPAFGWFKRMWHDGEVLHATIGDMTADVRDWIRNRNYTKVSIEAYREPHRSLLQFGLKGPWIQSVTLLGAKIPEVKGLRPLSTPVPQTFAQAVDWDAVARVPRRFSQAVRDRRLPRRPSTIRFTAAKRHGTKVFLFSQFEAKAMTPERQAILDALAQLGLDVSKITDATPDAELQAMLDWATKLVEQMTAPSGDGSGGTTEGGTQASQGGNAAGSRLPKSVQLRFSQDAAGGLPSQFGPGSVSHDVANAIGVIKSMQSQLHAQLQSLARKVDDNSAIHARDLAERKTNKVRQFCQAQVQAGRLQPKDADETSPTSVVSRMLRADDTKRLVFAQADGTNKQTTELDLQMEEVMQRPVDKRFAFEQAKGKGTNFAKGMGVGTVDKDKLAADAVTIFRRRRGLSPVTSTTNSN